MSETNANLCSQTVLVASKDPISCYLGDKADEILA
jgi:hypothetical protein